MSRIWESAERAAKAAALEPKRDVVDVRDEGEKLHDVSVRANDDHVVLTVAMDATTDIELTLSRDAAREISAALDDASRH